MFVWICIAAGRRFIRLHRPGHLFIHYAYNRTGLFLGYCVVGCADLLFWQLLPLPPVYALNANMSDRFLFCLATYSSIHPSIHPSSAFHSTLSVQQLGALSLRLLTEQYTIGSLNCACLDGRPRAAQLEGVGVQCPPLLGPAGYRGGPMKMIFASTADSLYSVLYK